MGLFDFIKFPKFLSEFPSDFTPAGTRNTKSIDREASILRAKAVDEVLNNPSADSFIVHAEGMTTKASEIVSKELKERGWKSHVDFECHEATEYHTISFERVN
jgi:hypothetical protein